MNYSEHKPGLILDRYVDFIAFNSFELTGSACREEVVPDGMTELVFNFGREYQRKTYSDAKFESVKGSHLVGVKSQPHILQLNPEMDTITIRFKPVGLSFFTNLPLNEFMDTAINADELFGRDIHEVEDILYNTKDKSQKIQVIEKFLTSRLSVSSKKNSTAEILYSIYKNPADFKLMDYVNKNGFYYKKLERHFKELIGNSPKLISQIIRVNYAIVLKLNNNSLSFTDLAYLSGYSDQSHFIKDFYRFTNKTPKDFFANLNSIDIANYKSVKRLFIILNDDLRFS